MRVDAPPTGRQIWALAAALCARAREELPENRAAASKLIERLRTETGHPSPRREDTLHRASKRSAGAT